MVWRDPGPECCGCAHGDGVSLVVSDWPLMAGPDVTSYRRDVLVSTLVYHQQTNTSGCHCGWGKRPEHLGLSWAEHLVDVYEMAATEGDQATDEVDRLRGIVEWWEQVARRHNICTGCGSPWQADHHLWGKSKCCPDCTHRRPS